MSLASSLLKRNTLLVCLLFVFPTTSAYSQQKPLTIESSTMQPSVALGRPMLTWWDVKIAGSGLLTGKFRFVIKSEGYTFATVETEELTLNGPDQRIRVVLPAVDCPQFIDQLLVDISFQGKKYSGDLGQQILRVPFATKTVFMGLIGESRTARKKSPQRDDLLEHLKFETLIPETKSLPGSTKEPEHVRTIFASIDPADFPSEPIAFCGFDIVVLMKDEFRNLRKPQLEALLSWVKSGGSLYLEPNGVLEGYHVDFLRNLTADDPQDVVFRLDEIGKLPQDTVPAKLSAMAFHCGLGDVVMRTTDPDRAIDATGEWQGIVGRLWKSRFRPADRPLVFRGQFGINGQPIQEVISESDPWGFMTASINRVTLQASELLDRLMPDGVRMVPLSLLATILIAFVCLIGPGDYYGLGWLRLRKLTWVTFPLATLGVTALTVWLSNSYMSVAETRRALIVRDLGPKGDIVRTNRFELLFVGSTHQVATSVERGSFTSLKTNPNGTMGGRSENGLVRSVTTQMQGRIPVQFTAIQDISKWTPQINRIMSIPGASASGDVKWSEFELSPEQRQSIRNSVIPPELIGRVKNQFGQDAMVACFTGSNGTAYDRATGWRSARSGTEPSVMNRPYQRGIPLEWNSVNHLIYEADLLRWIYHASVINSEQGSFAFTCRTAPKGGALCDDLPLLDTSDPSAWLLVVVIPEKDDFVVYRKLMRFSN